MKIIVCIKEVPDTTDIKINPETNTLIREGVESIINPFDMYALEEGIRLKEKLGGEVVVLSMGPPQAERSLREAMPRPAPVPCSPGAPASAGPKAPGVRPPPFRIRPDVPEAA